MSYNPNLSYFMSRLSGVSVNYFKLEPQNTTSASAGKIIRFSLPNNCLLNLNSIAMHFNATMTGGSSSRLPNRIDSIIDRYTIEAGGVQIAQGFNNYNVFRHVKDNLTSEHLDSVLGHTELVRLKSYVDGQTKAGNETYSTSATQFCINHWEGMIGTLSPSIIDTALMPEVVLTIFLAANDICVDSAGRAMAGTSSVGIDVDASSPAPVYQINNFHLTVETIGIQDSIYDELLAKKIQTTGYIEMPFKQYFSFIDTSTGHQRWNVASQSISRVWVAYRNPGYANVGGAISVNGYKKTGAFVDPSINAGTTSLDLGVPQYDTGGVYDTNRERLISKFFNFAEGANGGSPTYQLQVNGALIPQFRASTEHMFQITKNSLPVSKMTKLENMTLDQYKNNYFAWCVRFNLPGSEMAKEISGLDSRGLNLQGLLLSENVSTSQNVMIFVECDSTLRIGAGKAIEVVV